VIAAFERKEKPTSVDAAESEMPIQATALISSDFNSRNKQEVSFGFTRVLYHAISERRKNP
jgi:hypothetical protein